MSIYGVAERSAATGRASDRGAGDGELRADEHQQRLGVVRLGNCREGELGERAGTSDEAVSRAALLEIREPGRTASSWARPCPWESGRFRLCTDVAGSVRDHERGQGAIVSWGGGGRSSSPNRLLLDSMGPLSSVNSPPALGPAWQHHGAGRRLGSSWTAIRSPGAARAPWIPSRSLSSSTR
jgi:hypothetical protein